MVVFPILKLTAIQQVPIDHFEIKPRTSDRSEPEDFFSCNVEIPAEKVEGLIREGQLGTLGGAFGVGKTPFLEHLAFCVLKGIPFCGREVQRCPVIDFDFETPGPWFKRDLNNLAKRFKVPVPIVPDEMEIYLEHGAPDEPGTAKLCELIQSHESGDGPEWENRLRFLKEAIAGNPNALVIIDPVELLIRFDTTKKHRFSSCSRKFAMCSQDILKPRCSSLLTCGKISRGSRAFPGSLHQPAELARRNLRHPGLGEPGGRATGHGFCPYR